MLASEKHCIKASQVVYERDHVDRPVQLMYVWNVLSAQLIGTTYYAPP